MKRKGLVNWLDSKLIGMRTLFVQKNEGMGTVEIILIICSSYWLGDYL